MLVTNIIIFTAGTGLPISGFPVANQAAQDPLPQPTVRSYRDSRQQRLRVDQPNRRRGHGADGRIPTTF